MDYLVIGGGPAGLQMGYFLQRTGRDYLILESGPTPGTFFRTFPRHQRLLSINKPHSGWSDPELNLRVDWNSLLSDDPDLCFTRYSERYFPYAEDLVRYLKDFAAGSKLRIEYDTQIVRIVKNGCFQAVDQRGHVHQANRLIVATGFSKPYIPQIPGIETAELYGDVSIDPHDFLDQRVLIIGKGNSAFETADNLVETAAVIHVAGPSSIRLAWKSHYVGDLRAVNNNLLDTYQLKTQNALLDGTVQRIERRDGSYVVTVSFARAQEVTKNLHYDRVIVCTGFRFDPSIFADDCKPALVVRDRLPAQTSEWQSTNVPDMYFAGTLMQARDYHKCTGAFIHGFRYDVRALHRILERSITRPSGRSSTFRRPLTPSWRLLSPVSTAPLLCGNCSGFSATSLSYLTTDRRGTTRSCRSTTSTRVISVPPKRTSPSRSSTVPTTIGTIRSTCRSGAFHKTTPRGRMKDGIYIPWCGVAGAGRPSPRITLLRISRMIGPLPSIESRCATFLLRSLLGDTPPSHVSGPADAVRQGA